jgi:hypothetical protein
MGRPLFDLVPICRIRAHFITIDSYVLYGLLKEVGLVECNETVFVSMADEHWRSTFCIGKLENGNRTFTKTMDSDGISLCLHQMRVRNGTDDLRANGSVSFDLVPNDRVVGIDPGGCTIMHAAEILPNGCVVSYELSRCQYYKESGMIDAKRHTEKWNSDIKVSLVALSTVSSKGASLQSFQAYMAVLMQHAEELWLEYMRPRWARQRLRLYGGKKRCFANYFNRLEETSGGRRTVIAYGAAKFAPCAPGRLAAPTTTAYKECSYRFPTVLIDEFRTTQINHETGAAMDKVVRIDTGAAVRGLLWCSSTNPTGGKFVNRDQNAAINMLRCLALPTRPVELCRRPGLAALQQRVGKAIKC